MNSILNTNKIFKFYCRPLRSDEILPKQSYKNDRKNVELKTSHSDKNEKESSEGGNVKKSKSHNDAKAKEKEKSNSKSEKSTSNHKKKKAKSTGKENGDQSIDLLEIPELKLSNEKASKKDKKEKKEKKLKKSSKKLSPNGSKSGYEEALGISTPSKEIVTS